MSITEVAQGSEGLSPSEEGDAQDSDLLKRHLDMPAKLRDRARVSATIIGSASAVLLAGIVYGPPLLSFEAKAAGGVAGALLLISTGLYLVAAQTRPKPPKKDAKPPEPPETATALANQIEHWTRAAGWSGVLAGAALVVAVGVAVLHPTDVVRARVELRPLDAVSSASLHALADACPGLKQSFTAEVAQRDLLGAPPLLPVRPVEPACAGRTVHVPRNAIVLVVSEPR